MQRAVFDRSIIDGYRTSKTESIAMTAHGRRMFSGTSDGSIVLYECRPDTVGSTRYSCTVADTIRKPKEKKPCNDLIAVESWRALIGIVDGVVSAFDSQYSQSIGLIAEQKGSHCFSVNEQSRTLTLANKKKLFQYAWQGPGFALIREFNLADVPKSLLCVRNAVIVGYRKHYECLDLVTGLATRILDVEREHRMLITEMAGNIFRPDALLLSLGLQGVVLEMEKVLSGTSFAYGSTSEERLEWAGLPVFCQVVLPFLVSGLPDSVEIHDLASLSPLQRITVSSLGSHDISFCSCSVELSTSTQQFGFICNGEELSLLKMIPISKQVDELSARELHEDAISLYSLCAAAAPDYVKGVDINRLHETCANALLQKGDFDKAVKHYIDGNAEFVSVIRRFPDLVPPSMHPLLNIGNSSGSQSKAAPLAPQVLQRAATAVVHFCDYHRPRVIRRALRAESLKELGILDSSMNSLSSQHSSALFFGSGLSKGQQGHTGAGLGMITGAATALSKDDEEDEYISDPDEELRRAQLLDSVLLFALVNCQPSRRNATVQLLSSPNFCQVETSSVLLASQGNPYTEALLWLYRSHNLHSRVLDALKEEKSVAPGGWNREQFYLWAADYLRWLWYHEGDAALPKLALFALKPLLEFDAELGLSVLLCRPPSSSSLAGNPSMTSLSKASFGGKGLTISEVLTYLRACNPQPVVRKSVPFGSSTSTSAGAGSAGGSAGAGGVSNANTPSYSKYAALAGSSAVQAVVASMPLVSGHALGVAFLECIVSSGEAPANMHDEFAQLLVEGLQLQPGAGKGKDGSDDTAGAGANDTGARSLQQIYRRKLQSFLLTSVDYHPQRVLKFLPPACLHETALVLSRQGEHQAVLSAYVHRLQDMRLAEWYCDRIYTAFLMYSNHHGGASSSARVESTGRAALSGGPQGIANSSNNVSNSNITGSFSAPALIRRDDGIVSGMREAGDIYLILFKVLLMDRSEWEDPANADEQQDRDHEGCEGGVGGDREGSASGTERSAEQAVAAVIGLAERYHDRVDAAQLLELLPADTPIAGLLRYFGIVLEYGSTKKRNLQIIHQLLRVREVQIRTNN